jgi:hypothetical protein
MLFFFKYEMHIAAMLKFLGLNCDITLYLFFTQVLFYCCYSGKIFVILTRILLEYFLGKILVGSFAESCLPAVHPAGSVRGLWKIGLQLRPR